jgi:preprotein translocase subunit SecE
MLGKFKKFIADVQSEMKKVTWPTREQLTESTNVVIGVTLIITAIVYVIDIVLDNVLGLLF